MPSSFTPKFEPQFSTSSSQMDLSAVFFYMLSVYHKWYYSKLKQCSRCSHKWVNPSRIGLVSSSVASVSWSKVLLKWTLQASITVSLFLGQICGNWGEKHHFDIGIIINNRRTCKTIINNQKKILKVWFSMYYFSIHWHNNLADNLERVSDHLWLLTDTVVNKQLVLTDMLGFLLCHITKRFSLYHLTLPLSKTVILVLETLKNGIDLASL
jgi:hypothetical protein